jgi:hypothetical protein
MRYAPTVIRVSCDLSGGLRVFMNRWKGEVWGRLYEPACIHPISGLYMVPQIRSILVNFANYLVLPITCFVARQAFSRPQS